jgi:hypothetical protein
MAGTRGHPLFVVETIRGLAAGESGIPGTLRDAILQRVARAGDRADTLLRAAAVLGSSFEPALVAGLLQLPTPEAARQCEQLLESRLIVVAGRSYEFAHDLVNEVLYATTPEPTRLSYHRAAADLLVDRPEAVAAHAAASEDWPRAARSGLLAAERAAQRYAAADAERLLTNALAAAGAANDLELRARIHVARGLVREVLAAYRDAERDLWAGARLARDAGDTRLELCVRRTGVGSGQRRRTRPAHQYRPALCGRTAARPGRRRICRVRRVLGQLLHDRGAGVRAHRPGRRRVRARRVPAGVGQPPGRAAHRRGLPDRRRRRVARARRPWSSRAASASSGPATSRTSSRPGSRRWKASSRSCRRVRRWPTSAVDTAPRRCCSGRPTPRRRSSARTITRAPSRAPASGRRRPAWPTECPSTSPRRRRSVARTTTWWRRSTACTTWVIRPARPGTSGSRWPRTAPGGSWSRPHRTPSRAPQPSRPGLLRLLDVPVRAQRAVAERRLRTRRPGRRGGHPADCDRCRLHPVPSRGRDAVQPGVRGPSLRRSLRSRPREYVQ